MSDSLPVEQVKPMTDTTDTELENLLVVLDVRAEVLCYPEEYGNPLTNGALKDFRTTLAALRSYVSERTLSDADLGFLLSGEYGARNCPCQYCGALSKKLDAILKSPRNQGVPR